MECVEVNAFVENLRSLCDERGVAARISRVSGVSAGYLYAVMRGEKTPTISVAARISRAAGKSLTEMLSCCSQKNLSAGS